MTPTERQYWAGTRDRYEKSMSYDAYDKGVRESEKFMKEVLSRNNKKEMTSEELKNKYGTDNTDIINAGKESKDRVSLKEEKSENSNNINSATTREKELADKIKHYGVKNGKSTSWTDEEEAKRIYNEDYKSNTELRFASDEYMQKRDNSLKQFWNKYNEHKFDDKPFDFDKEYSNIEKNITADDRKYLQSFNDYNKFVEQASKELGYDKNTTNGEEYFKIQRKAKEIRDKNIANSIHEKSNKISNYRDSVNEIAKNSAKDNVTLNIETGEEMNFKTGYSVSFQQSSDNYSDEEYNAKIKECREKCDGNVYVGKYGGDAEPSFHTEDLETAKEIMYKYNQESIYDAKHDTLIMNDRYDASKNKTNYKAETTNDIMNKAIRNKINKKRGKVKEDLPKKVKIETQGTSNRKEVSENIQAHILSYYDKPEDFVQQMDAMSYLPTNWHRGEELAKGGMYMIYYDDQREFLDSLKINPKGKKFSDDRVAQTYNNLIGRESAKLYERLKRNAYRKYLQEHPGSEMSFSEFKEMVKED